jgi:predicted small secreted protein
MNKLVVATIMIMALTGCNTFRGVGEDLQGAGRWMSSTADSTSNNSSKKLRPVEDNHNYPNSSRPEYLD